MMSSAPGMLRLTAVSGAAGAAVVGAGAVVVGVPARGIDAPGAGGPVRGVVTTLVEAPRVGSGAKRLGAGAVTRFVVVAVASGVVGNPAGFFAGGGGVGGG